MVKLLRDTLVIVKIRSSWIRNQPTLYLGTSFFIPIVLSLLFWMMGMEMTERILLGSMVYSLVYPAVATVGKSVAYDKIKGSFTLFSTSPISPYAYILGTALSTLPSSLIPFLMFMLASTLIFGLNLTVISFILSLMILVFGALSLSFLGFSLGFRLRDPRSSDVIVDMIWALMIFLSPVYIPWSRIPEIVRPVSLAMPTTYLAELLNLVLWGRTFLSTSVLVGANVAFFSFFAMIALRYGKMRES